MSGQLRAEMLKQRSTQTTLFLFLAMFGLVALASALHVLAPSPSELASRSHQLEVFEVGTRVGMLFAALVGAIAITAEIRYGTIRPTFLATPRRGPVIAAKLAVSGLAGLVFGLLAEGLMAAMTTAALALRGIPNQLDSGDYLQLLVGGTAAAALWATIGLGIGALVRNQVGTLVALCAWILLIENLLLFVPDVARYAPGAAGLALAGRPDELPAAAGALMLILYAVAASAGGWLATLRRDVA
jgi:ABC-type transport system involved in multi-copper enzyme maturation permease subunit